MTTTRKGKADQSSGLDLPAPIYEEGYPKGDGPLWISKSVGAPESLRGVTRLLSSDGDETALILAFTWKGRDYTRVICPARLVTTRRLADELGALGFPVPYYSLPKLARIGQAIGRVADRALNQEEVRSWETRVSFLSTWMQGCLAAHPSYILSGRAGVDVRAAISHVRQGESRGFVPIVVEPVRNTLSVWTVPMTVALRQHFGTTDDGVLGVKLRQAGLVHDRLAARKAPPARTGTDEIPVWALYNGWEGVEVEMPDEHGESGPLKLCPL